MLMEGGPVLDFLMAYQNVENVIDLDWDMARDTLKNARVNVASSNQEHNIFGLSENNCNEQMFTLRNKTTGEEVEMTVSDYFENVKNTTLEYSGDYPCIAVGRPNRPTYFPIELCEIVPRQEPPVKMDALFTMVMVNKAGVFLPNGGRDSNNNKEFVEPANITNWVCVNFSATCNTEELISDLMSCAKSKGINIDDPLCVIEEDVERKDASANTRVDQMFDDINSVIPKSSLTFILCILSKTRSDVYGPWKEKNLSEHGIVTQCITPKKVNDQYLTNVLMKINAKLGGLNFSLDIEEHSLAMRLVMDVPTMIIGMNVYKGSSSLAAVVSSREWPQFSKYKACVRTQLPNVEIIDNLFKLNSNKDEGIFRELLLDFISTSELNSPPMHIIIFRDGVSGAQFQQVLDIELGQIMKACEHVDENWNPKFTVIVAKKMHHTSSDDITLEKISDILEKGDSANFSLGELITDESNLLNLNAQKGNETGTTRLTYYPVLKNEIGFSPDDLLKLVHSLSYNFQRSTRPISIVAPIQYAHLAAAQMATMLKSKESSENSASHSGITAPGAVPPMLELHDNIASTMFFC